VCKMEDSLSLKKARRTIVDLEQEAKDRQCAFERLEAEKRELERKNAHLKRQLNEARARFHDKNVLRSSLDKLVADEERCARMDSADYTRMDQQPLDFQHAMVYIYGGNVTINNNSPRSPSRSPSRSDEK
jgi:hypothetical protein